MMGRAIHRQHHREGQMTNEQPGSGTEPGAPWPQELTPPPVPPVAPPPVEPAPAPAAPSAGTWSSAPSAGTWSSPAPQAAPQPAPQWNAPAAPQAPQPQQPPQWGAPPAGTPPPQGQWGAPPQQPGGWAPTGGPAAPGGPGMPPASWAPAPAKSGNGCLKACLIVGGILVVIGIILAVIVGIFFQRVVSSMPVGPNGELKACPLIATSDVQDILGQDAVAFPLEGFLGDLVNAPVDERMLKDADDCWILSNMNETGATTAGRLAAQDDGNASSTFASIKAAGQSTYTASDVSGVGDEAFCTGGTDGLGFGIFARGGNKLVYVSLIDPNALANGLDTAPNGVEYSQASCDLAAQLAKAMLK